MSKRLRWIALPVAVAVLGGAGLLAAQGLADEQDWHGGPWGGWMEGLVERMDTDKDGAVGRAEVQSFEAARAAEIDADKNGAITVAELVAWIDRQRTQRLAESLARMDGDGDGAVSVEEYRTEQIWRMARLDRDGNGVIGPDEMRVRGRMPPHR